MLYFRAMIMNVDSWSYVDCSVKWWGYWIRGRIEVYSEGVNYAAIAEEFIERSVAEGNVTRGSHVDI